MNKTLICALAATVLAGVGFAGDARKGLKFWWRAGKKTAIGAPLEAGEFQEHMTWSKSAAPSQPYRLNQTTQHDTYPVEPMCVTNVPVHFATARRTVDQDCLYFAEPMFDMASGGKAIDRQSVFLPQETSMLGKEGTLFVRFMWLGRHFSERTVVNFIGMGASWGASGWAIGFGGYGTKDGAYVRFRNYKTTNDTYENSTSGLVNAGEWIELAISFKPITVDGVEKTQVSMYKQRDVTKRLDFDTWTLESEALVLPSSGGCQISNADGSGIRENMTSSASFRGLVHEIKMYDRALDADEVRQVMAGDDADWSVGSQNGSADEFSDDADVPDVFEPATMPWNRFRKTLTADNPSVSVKYDLDADGHDLARLLQMRFMPDTLTAGTRVRIDVNGVKVGEKRVTGEGGYETVFLSGDVMSSLTQDEATGKYPLTVTFTRTDNLDGALVFDWLSLGGSWQLGRKDDSNAEFGANNTNKNCHYMLAMRNIKEMVKVFGVNYSSTILTKDLDITFSLTEDEAASYAHQLHVRGSSYAKYKVYLNGLEDGCLVKDVTNTQESRWGYNVSLPAGRLTGGLNTIYFVGTGGAWANLDYMKLSVIDNGSKNRDPRGACLVIR